MHICFLASEYPLWNPGGVGSVIQTLGRRLVALGHKASVVCLANPGEDVDANDHGVVIHRIRRELLLRPRAIGNGFKQSAWLRKIHQANPIDVLEATELGLAFIDHRLPFAKVIRMHGGHRFFATTLGRSPAAWRSYMESRSFSKADGLAAVSNFVGTTTLSLLGEEDRPFQVIYNAVDPVEFSPTPVQTGPGKRILFFGTVCEKKGVRQLVQAMPLIRRRHPEATLDIVGRDTIDPASGGSYTAGLMSEIASDQRASINFYGPVPRADIPSRVAHADLCVLPSHMEAMPMAWLEVMAMGKPLVGSRTGPGPEAVRHGETGLLCDPTKPEDIAKNVICMLDSPEESQRMAERGRESVVKHFSLDRMVADSLRFYEAAMR